MVRRPFESLKECRDVPLVGVLVPGEHQPDAAPGDVSEAGVEAHKVAAADQVDAYEVFFNRLDPFNSCRYIISR